MKKILFLILCLPVFSFGQVAKHNSSGVNTFLDTRYVNVPGDTMTGQLTLSGSSLTVTGNAFSVGGSTFVVSGGNVGVGGTPTTALHVNMASGQAIITAQTGSGSGTNATLSLIGGGANASWYAPLTNRGDICGAVDNLCFYKIAGTAGAKMVIQDGGNVGIGTTGPGSRFEVVGGSSTFRGSDSNSAIAGFTDAGGNYRVVISTAGNVGIGTTSPAVKLQVTGTNSFSVNPSFVASNEIPSGTNVASRDTNLSLSANSVSGTAGDKIALTYYNNNQWYSGLELANVASGFSNLLLMKSGGNVGIGTVNPGSMFEVVGGSSTFRGSDSNSAIAGFTDAGGNYRVVISTAGNVGIGNTAPDSKLHISSGTLKLDGAGALFNISVSSTITTATDTCVKGDIRWDASFLFICTTVNTWKRVAIATWP